MIFVGAQHGDEDVTRWFASQAKVWKQFCKPRSYKRRAKNLPQERYFPQRLVSMTTLVLLANAEILKVHLKKVGPFECRISYFAQWTFNIISTEGAVNARHNCSSLLQSILTISNPFKKKETPMDPELSQKILMTFDFSTLTENNFKNTKSELFKCVQVGERNFKWPTELLAFMLLTWKYW